MITSHLQTAHSLLPSYWQLRISQAFRLSNSFYQNICISLQIAVEHSISPKPSVRLQTAHALLASYSALSVPALLEPLDANFTHQVLPSSLNMPARNREAFAAHASVFNNIFSSFRMSPKTIYEDAANNAVVAYCDMIGELKGLGEWRNECVIMLRFTEDGKRVVEHREFVDSSKARELKEKLVGMMSKDKANGLMQC